MAPVYRRQHSLIQSEIVSGRDGDRTGMNSMVEHYHLTKIIKLVKQTAEINLANYLI